jgi:hypothetical protein
LTLSHILLDVFKIERHESLDPMIRLNQSVLRKPGFAGGGGKEIADRFCHAASRQREKQDCRTSTMDEDVPWLCHDYLLSGE